MPTYEIRVAGPIGPVVASALTGFTTVEVSTSTTVLTGTVGDAEDLVEVISVLNAHGFSPIDTLINPLKPDRRADSGLPSAVGAEAVTRPDGSRSGGPVPPRRTWNADTGHQASERNPG
jgi:hypothetical protein